MKSTLVTYLKVLFAFALLNSLPLFGQDEVDAKASADPLVSVVKSKGQGETPEKAEKSALIRAVVKAVGALVDQETLVKNDELIRDQILSVSSGFVKSFKVVQESKKNLEGDYETVLEVVVEKRKLEKSLSEKGLVKVSSNAKDIWAETFSKDASAEDAMRMLEAKLPSLIERLFSVTFFEDAPKPVLLSRDSSKNTAKLLWWVKLSSDTKFWYSQVAPMLDTCLSAIEASERDDSSIRSSEKSELVIATAQPVLGSFLKTSDFKIFALSKSKCNKLRKALGAAVLNCSVKNGDDLIAVTKFSPATTIADIAKFIYVNPMDLIGVDLGNDRLELEKAGSSEKRPALVRLVESKPKDAPLGGLFFSSEAAFPSSATPTSRGGYLVSNDLIPQPYSIKEIGGNARGALASYFSPETVVNGAASFGTFAALGWWRAPRPGFVAFPVVLDLPISEINNTLEVSVKFESSSKP